MHHNQLHLHHTWASAGTLLGDSFYRIQRHPSTDLAYTSHDLLIAGRLDLGLLQRAPRHVWTLACSPGLLLHVSLSRETLGNQEWPQGTAAHVLFSLVLPVERQGLGRRAPSPWVKTWLHSQHCRESFGFYGNGPLLWGTRTRARLPMGFPA